MNDYVPLLEALEGRFEQSLDELPDALRERVPQDIPRPWDSLSPVERRHWASAYDYMHSPATKQLLQSLIQQIIVAEPAEQIEDILKRKLALEQEINELDMTTVASISDRELKKVKKTEAQQEIDQIELQLSQARGDYLEVEDSAISTSSCQPADSEQIIRNFRVQLNEDQNAAWWESQMRDANRGKFKLADCRVGAGRKGRGPKSLWRPDQIAGWLIDRNDRGRDGLNSSAAAEALRKFPGCADIADLLFPPEK